MFDMTTRTLAAALFATLPMATQAAVVTDLSTGQSYSVNEMLVPGTTSTVFAFGATAITGGTFEAGDTFTLTFSTTRPTTQLLTVFAAFNTAAVPVPAADLLLLTALGGLAAMRRCKTEA